MAYGYVLHAISDPTRRKILESIRLRSLSVGELAEMGECYLNKI